MTTNIQSTATNVGHNNFIRSAMLISLGGLVAKLLGAIYRIPLTNLLGSYGMGLYQLIFPPYILLLILAGFGIPLAVSRLVAESNQLGLFDRSCAVFTQAKRMLFATGLIGSITLFVLAKPLANMQNLPALTTAYRLVSPAILLVCVTGAYKGYFQGNMSMLPLSLAQVIEQLAKLLIGLLVANKMMPNVQLAVYGAVFAITISEAVSMLIIYIAYRIMPTLPHRNCNLLRANDNNRYSCYGDIFKLALPVVIAGFIMQLTQLVDSFLVVNMVTLDNATSLYGLWSGPVNSLLGLPVTLSAGVAVSALPHITRAYTDLTEQNLNAKYNSAIKLTLVIALPSALGITVMAKPIIGLLYSSLPVQELNTCALLVVLAGISIVSLSLLQTIVATLQALRKPYIAVVMLSIAVVSKLLINLFLLPLENINILGAAISESMCFSLASISGIIYLQVKQKLRIDCLSCAIKPISCCLVMLVGLLSLSLLATDFVNSIMGTIITVSLCAIMYLGALALFKVFGKDEVDISRLLRRREITSEH
ncbi:MAG: polysaccharide biosynthesis protein [Clostridia bacterium]|nr:polysaccharide biosynthesis protein [Clostridia bacterium]